MGVRAGREAESSCECPVCFLVFPSWCAHACAQDEPWGLTPPGEAFTAGSTQRGRGGTRGPIEAVEVMHTACHHCIHVKLWISHAVLSTEHIF